MLSFTREFAILRYPLRDPDFLSIPLFGGWILNAHKSLPVAKSAGESLILLGDAWTVLPGEKCPAEQLSAFERAHPEPDLAALLKMEALWCGRYVLIAGDLLLTDTAALLGVYYAPEGISSSLALLSRESRRPVPAHLPDRSRQRLGWMPPPDTPCEGILRLLPSQILSVKEHKVLQRPLLMPEPEKLSAFLPLSPLLKEGGKLSEERRIALFTDLFVCSLQNMAKSHGGKKLFLALTGGVDSRTLLALAHRARLPVSCFSLEHEQMPEADLSIPPLLARTLSLPFVRIPRDLSRFEEGRLALYDAFVSHEVADEDRLFYAFHQYEALREGEEEILLLRSSVWESVIGYFSPYFDGEKAGPHFFDAFELRMESPEARSLRHYFTWAGENPQPGLSFADRFLLEQRSGGWLSSIEQGFSLLPGFESLQPANCRLFLSILAGFDEKERRTKEHQKKIIRYACPQIASIPYDSGAISGQGFLGKRLSDASKALHKTLRIGPCRAGRFYLRKLTKKE